jgi:hypothetical protein
LALAIGIPKTKNTIALSIHRIIAYFSRTTAKAIVSIVYNMSNIANNGINVDPLALGFVDSCFCRHGFSPYEVSWNAKGQVMPGVILPLLKAQFLDFNHRL